MGAMTSSPDDPRRLLAPGTAAPDFTLPTAPDQWIRLSEFRGKPVVLGTQASGVTALGRTVLKSLDIEVQPIILEKAADGPPMLLDGRAEALWGAGVGWPAFAALAKAGGRFIVPSEAEVERIRVAALLHDVGKVAVPQSILDKPAALTAAEWRSVVQHPRIGQVILEHAAALRDALRPSILLIALLFFGAYLLVLAALRLAEPGPVAAVRETSVVMATALGALILHEPVTRARAAGALVVVAGAAVIALS